MVKIEVVKYGCVEEHNIANDKVNEFIDNLQSQMRYGDIKSVLIKGGGKDEHCKG